MRPPMHQQQHQPQLQRKHQSQQREGACSIHRLAWFVTPALLMKMALLIGVGDLGQACVWPDVARSRDHNPTRLSHSIKFSLRPLYFRLIIKLLKTISSNIKLTFIILVVDGKELDYVTFYLLPLLG